MAKTTKTDLYHMILSSGMQLVVDKATMNNIIDKLEHSNDSFMEVTTYSTNTKFRMAYPHMAPSWVMLDHICEWRPFYNFRILDADEFKRVLRENKEEVDADDTE